MSSLLSSEAARNFIPSGLLSRIAARHAAKERLHWLNSEDSQNDQTSRTAAFNVRIELKNFQGRLGRAGLLAHAQRRRFLVIASVFTLGFCGLLVFATKSYGAGVSLLGVVVGIYGASLLLLLYLRRAEKQFNQQILSELPLVLESIILLVESGLGVLPALEQVTNSSEISFSEPPVKKTLLAVYQLSKSGMPFSQALEEVARVVSHPVLRHVLLHLDVSGAQGGELVPALRALAEHAQVEWRLAVEHRVSQLENYVVFPVFIAVIGLMLVTAAVPLVPVLEFMDSIDSSKSGVNSPEVLRGGK